MTKLDDLAVTIMDEPQAEFPAASASVRHPLLPEAMIRYQANGSIEFFPPRDKMRDQIFAYTAPGSQYPEYVNFASDGDLVVTVRGPRQLAAGSFAFDLPGQAVSVVVPRAQLPPLIAALQKMLAPKRTHQDEDDGA